MESLPLPSVKLESIKDPGTVKADVLVAGLTEDGEMSPSLKQIDTETDGAVSRLVSSGEVTGKVGDSILVALPGASAGPASILLVGLGGPSTQEGPESARSRMFDVASAAIRSLSDRARDTIAMTIAEAADEDTHDAIVAGVIYGCEGQGIYQSEPSAHVPETVCFSNITEEQIRRGRVIGESLNFTRRLVNEPPDVVYPASFADRTVAMGESCGIDVEVWDEKKLQAEGCRAILAVGAGSVRPPRLVILRHSGGDDEPPIALVGKGVTFDSGGLSLKPSDGMVTMKCDMAGAATVVGVMQAVKKLGIKRNIIGYCGLAENMVSGDSYKLGDVIETRSGKMIEIMNTDAEGRVVLADTLDVAVQHQPTAIVDLATLTGACVVALGTDVAGLMTNEQSLCEAVQQSAKKEGEPVWQLPMFSLYDEKIKSKVADIRNTGEGRWGGAMTAAKFLENFVGETPWLHIDIAGVAFAESQKPHRDAGATGAMVRTLIRWLETAE